MLSALAIVAACVSALLLYRAAPQTRVSTHGRRRLLRGASALAAALALAAAIADLGVGAGLCLMLAAWMLAAVALPYLALWWRLRAGTEPR